MFGAKTRFGAGASASFGVPVDQPKSRTRTTAYGPGGAGSAVTTPAAASNSVGPTTTYMVALVLVELSALVYARHLFRKYHGG